MADLNKEILSTLRAIENYTKQSASVGAKSIANRGNNLGNESSKFNSDMGLIASFKNLRKATAEESKARVENSKILAAETIKNRKNNQELDKLKQSIIDQIKDNKSALSIQNKVKQQLNALGDIGEELKFSFGQISDMNKGEFLTAINNAKDSLNGLANAARSAQSTAKANAEASKKQMDDSVTYFKDSVLVTIGTAIASAIPRLSQAAITSQAGGFKLGDAAGGGWDGLWNSFTGLVGDSIEAFKTGASSEDAYRFATANRAALSTAAEIAEEGNAAMTNARVGMEAVTEYGNKLNNMFGMTGADQLTAIGQSLSTLTNTGTVPTMNAMSEYSQMIANLSATSNKTASELFAEFDALSNDSDFQQLFLSLGKGATITDYLNNSFLGLQKAVGMNMDEFISYQKYMADQQKRTGSTRVVQAAFAGQLARGLGFSKSDIGLIQRGTAFQESLKGPDAERFKALQIEMGKRGADVRSQMAERMDVSGLQTIDILVERSNTVLQAAMVQRDRSEVNQTQALAQGDRLAAAAEGQLEKLNVVNNTLQEIWKGFMASPIGGAAAGLFSGIGGAVFAGTVAGNLASSAGGIALLGPALAFLGAAGVGAVGGNWLAENTPVGGIGESIGGGIYEFLHGDQMNRPALALEAKIKALEAEYDERAKHQIAEIEANNDILAEGKDTNTATLEEIKQTNKLLKEMLEKTLDEKEDAILQLKNASRRRARGAPTTSRDRG